MKTKIPKLLETIQDYFKISMDTYKYSREEAFDTLEFFHNRQFTQEQINLLINRNQPIETFNIVKALTRAISGYCASVINTINVKASQEETITLATVGQDIITHTLNYNNFDALKLKIQEGLILEGLIGLELKVKQLNTVDDFGIPHNQIVINHIPSSELVIDPMSTELDYSDAKYISKFRWVSKEDLLNIFSKEKVTNLEENISYQDATDYTLKSKFNVGAFVGRYNEYDTYLIITTYIKIKGVIKEVIWCHDTILKETDLPGLKDFPIKPYKLEHSHVAEYYGLFREVIESQKAINQAIITIQLMVNTNKVYVADGAVRDIDEFRDMFNRVNSVIPVANIEGIKIDNLNADIVNQYHIIDRALEKIKFVLNLNDSFLGNAGSSASGRQVKLQQNMTSSALNYLTSTLNLVYKSLGTNILELAKAYYKSNKIYRITDDVQGDKYIELNKPLTVDGELAINFDTMDIKEDVVYLEPYRDPDTVIEDLNYDVIVTTANFNETEEVSQLLLDQILNGTPGQMLLNTNPAAYARIVALKAKSMRVKYATEISDIFTEMANQLAPQTPTVDPRLIGQNEGQSPQDGSGNILNAMGAYNDLQPAGYNNQGVVKDV